MKFPLTIIIPLFLILLVSGCTQQMQPTFNTNNIDLFCSYDDHTCTSKFANYIKTCFESTTIISDANNIYFATNFAFKYFKLEYKIKEKTEESCLIDLKIKETDNGFEHLNDLSGSCIIPLTELEEFSMNPDYSYCTGSVFDYWDMYDLCMTECAKISSFDFDLDPIEAERNIGNNIYNCYSLLNCNSCYHCDFTDISCGDGICEEELNENSIECPKDCGLDSYCGDELCNRYSYSLEEQSGSPLVDEVSINYHGNSFIIKVIDVVDDENAIIEINGDQSNVTVGSDYIIDDLDLYIDSISDIGGKSSKTLNFFAGESNVTCSIDCGDYNQLKSYCEEETKKECELNGNLPVNLWGMGLGSEATPLEFNNARTFCGYFMDCNDCTSCGH